MYEKAAQAEFSKKELIILDIDNMNLYHEFNFIFLKNSIFASSYINFYNFLVNT